MDALKTGRVDMPPAPLPDDVTECDDPSTGYVGGIFQEGAVVQLYIGMKPFKAKILHVPVAENDLWVFKLLDNGERRIMAINANHKDFQGFASK